MLRLRGDRLRVKSKIKNKVEIYIKIKASMTNLRYVGWVLEIIIYSFIVLMKI